MLVTKKDGGRPHWTRWRWAGMVSWKIFDLVKLYICIKNVLSFYTTLYNVELRGADQILANKIRGKNYWGNKMAFQ